MRLCVIQNLDPFINGVEITRVCPGILPPTIRTTPNSPMVWAKLRIAAVR